MARNTMQRRFVLTEIKLNGVIIQDGKVHAEPIESITVAGKITMKKAQKIADDEYLHNFDKVIVIDLVETEKLHEMEISKFLEHATEVQE